MSDAFRDPISAHHATYSEQRIRVSEEVSLRVVSWQPKDDDAGSPIVFVAGWVSIVTGWAGFLHALTRKHPVHYIETREKKSAEIRKDRPRADDFRIERFAEDVITVCSRLPIDMEEAIVSGSSLGATVLLEALKHERMKAKGVFLVGPACDFHVPFALRWMPYLFPSPAYHVVKHFLVWYFRKFRVDVEKEPEQMRRYQNTILSAHPLRIKLSGRAFMHYKVWPELETVKAPTRIACAPTDKLHASDDMTRMAETIQTADLLPCESNKYMHSAPLAEDLCRFVSELQDGHPARAADRAADTNRPSEKGHDAQEQGLP